MRIGRQDMHCLNGVPVEGRRRDIRRGDSAAVLRGDSRAVRTVRIRHRGSSRCRGVDCPRSDSPVAYPSVLLTLSVAKQSVFNKHKMRHDIHKNR